MTTICAQRGYCPRNEFYNTQHWVCFNLTPEEFEETAQMADLVCAELKDVLPKIEYKQNSYNLNRASHITDSLIRRGEDSVKLTITLKELEKEHEPARYLLEDWYVLKSTEKPFMAPGWEIILDCDSFIVAVKPTIEVKPKGRGEELIMEMIIYKKVKKVS